MCSVPTDIWQLPDVQQALVNREFGSMCLLIRQHGGLRQDDMAEITGLSQPFLSMLESGARKLTNIDKIVELLGGLQAPPELTGPMLRPSIHHHPRVYAATAL
ncbi:helix-turn-helix domain-containing protein [Streptomyces sp. NPDC002851]